MLAPTFGPTVGGWIADNWSWRWIFYINLPIGVLGFFMASALLTDSAHAKPPGRVDVSGLLLMVLGFGCLQLVLDRGERADWFDSTAVTALAVVAVAALAAFVIRELTRDGAARRPRASSPTGTSPLGSVVMALAGFGFYASMLLLALYHAEAHGLRRVDLGAGPRPQRHRAGGDAPHRGLAGEPADQRIRLSPSACS